MAAQYTDRPFDAVVSAGRAVPCGHVACIAPAMGDKRRELIALRAIVVSGRAALRQTSDQGLRERIRDRVTELLAELEASVIRDGADREVLQHLDEARRAAWD